MEDGVKTPEDIEADAVVQGLILAAGRLAEHIDMPPALFCSHVVETIRRLIRSFETAVPQTRHFRAGTGTATLCSSAAITKPPSQGESEAPEDFRVGPADRASVEAGNRKLSLRNEKPGPSRPGVVTVERDGDAPRT